jgi:hypothetical protein
MKKLQEQDFIDAAALLNCDIAAIKAVAEVESLGGGFKNDLPVILFEGHWFWTLTKGKFGHTNYSYPKWTKKFYSMNQHARLESAAQKDRNAALQSASWGMFQIMGFNFKKAGFKTLQEFINAMFKSEREHLLAFCNFVIASGIDDELREHKWDQFAYIYNGPKYRENNYQVKLATAYTKFKKLNNGISFQNCREICVPKSRNTSHQTFLSNLE